MTQHHNNCATSLNWIYYNHKFGSATKKWVLGRVVLVRKSKISALCRGRGRWIRSDRKGDEEGLSGRYHPDQVTNVDDVLHRTRQNQQNQSFRLRSHRKQSDRSHGEEKRDGVPYRVQIECTQASTNQR